MAEWGKHQHQHQHQHQHRVAEQEHAGWEDCGRLGVLLIALAVGHTVLAHQGIVRAG